MTNRRDRLLALLPPESQGILITDPRNLFYLTGFTGEGELLLSDQGLLLLTDGRFLGEAEACGLPYAVRGPGAEHDHAALARGLDIAGLAIEADHMSHAEALQLQQNIPLAATRGLVAQLRVCKDAGEIAALRRAITLTDNLLCDIMSWCSFGHCERQIAACLNFEAMSRGASGESFPAIVAAGVNAAKPHAQPGDDLARDGNLLIDCGFVVDGYCSDVTRTRVGRAPAPIARAAELVHAAHDAALAHYRPGVPLRDAHMAAVQVFAQAEMEQHFTHSLGHGVGLNVHEEPRIGPASQGVFREGMVVSCEPGLYFPGIGGVRHENLILITADGPEPLTRAPQWRETI